MRFNLSINQFTDYRSFLVAYVQDMKRTKKNWSCGAWTQTLGLKTTSSITKILNGERDPGPQITERLIRYFKFDTKQAQYFRDLVKLQKIKNDPRLSVLLMEKMGKDHPDSKLRIIDDKSFQVISNWYYLAVREFCRMHSFKEEAEWISEEFLFKVTSREIVTAIKTLLELGLLVRNAKGYLCLAEGRLNTTNDISNEAIKRYHEQMLENAKGAIRIVPPGEREITSTTLVMRSANIEKAKELIRDFKNNFEKLMEEDSGDRVFQIQIQLFPLTK
ncbi:MAG: TIGR02147 family protein [Pseudobdellovibrionaceae bacterium]